MNGDHFPSRLRHLKQRLQSPALAAQAASSQDRQRKSEIYRQRAVLLATRRTGEDSSRRMTPALAFALGDQHFAVPLLHVAQVYPGCFPTPVPRTPSWVLGIASFESQIRSVIDLANLLNVSTDRPLTVGNILLVRGSAGTVAVRVDRVEEVQKIDFDKLVAPDQRADISPAGLVRGVTADYLAILSVDALLAHTASPQCDLS